MSRHAEYKHPRIGAATLLGVLLLIPAVADGQDQEGGEVKPDTQAVRLTVIYDNNSTSDSLEAAWGFSCLVRGYERTILFDTGGEGSIFMANLDELGVGVDAVDDVVISHWHSDHLGGLDRFLSANPKVNVYMLRSFPSQVKDMARSRGARVIEVTAPVEICPGVRTTGEIPAPLGAPEQSLLLSTAEGTVVLTGCAHPGIVEIAERALELSGRNPVAAIGGFHLHRTGEVRVRELISRLRSLGVRYAAPCHCSGDRARELFKTAFGTSYIDCGVGATIEFQSSETDP